MAVASALDTGRIIGKVALPTLAKGVIVRRPLSVALAERFGLDASAVALLRGLRDRYGPGPLRLRIPGRDFVLVLGAEDVGRVLDGSPEPFALATREKKAALAHFQPNGVLVSEGEIRTRRRHAVESVLETGHEVHSLAGNITAVVRDEADLLTRHAVSTGSLTWDGFALAWWRAVRRIVLGNGARPDRELTDELASLRAHGNWAYLHPRRERLRAKFDRRLRNHLERAEPGSLAEVVARTSASDDVDFAGQVPHWLFAFDAAGIATMRALALLAGRQPEPDHLRASVLESVRLWPTTPMILRESTERTELHGEVYAAGTTFLVFAPYFHRDPERLPFANRFTPEIWLDGRAQADPALVPFSGGPGVCPGRNLVLLTTSTMLGALLEHHTFRLRSHEIGAEVPATLNHFALKFDVE